LALARQENAIDTFTLAATRLSEDLLIGTVQALVRLLEQAQDYWQSDWPPSPVYLVARGPNETNTRYAVVRGYALDGLSTPYGAPWLPNVGGGVPALENITLSLEHGPWLECVPGTAIGVEADSSFTWYEYGGITGIAGKTSYPILANGDNVNVYYDVGTSTWVITTLNTIFYFGQFAGEWSRLVLAFQNIPINAGAHLLRASLQMERISGVGPNIVTRIHELSRTLWAGTSLDDLLHVLVPMRSAASVPWRYMPKATLTDFFTPDVTMLAQLAVEESSWAAGRDMVLLIEPKIPSVAGIGANSLGIASLAHATALPPRLWLTYVNDPAASAVTLGRAPTTLQEHVLTNEVQRDLNLTHIFRRNAAGVYDAVNYATSDSFDIFTSVDTGVETYFGIANDLHHTMMPSALVFDLSVAFPSAAIVLTVWEYYNGAAWGPLAVMDHTAIVEASNQSFGATGVGIVCFDKESDSEAVAINGVTAHWVRCRIVDDDGIIIIPPGTGPHQQNRPVYIPTQAGVTITADQVPGDYPALARLIVTPFAGTVARALFAIRSAARGEHFTPHLHARETGNPSGVHVQYSTYFQPEDEATYPQTALSSITVDLATGATAEADVLILDATLAPEYAGRYRLFLYADGIFGTSGGIDSQGGLITVTVRQQSALRWESHTIFSQQRQVYSANYQYIDFGLLTIPHSVDNNAEIVFAVRYERLGTDGEYKQLRGFMLWPVDEWSAECFAPDDDHTFDGNTIRRDTLILDGVQPRWDALARVVDASGVETQRLAVSSVGPPILQANVEQRLYSWLGAPLVAPGYGPMPVSHWMFSVERVARYAALRGDQ